MSRDFNEIEKAILRRVQGMLPDTADPYAVIAAEVAAETGKDVGETDVLALLKELVESGAIRRFGASLKHQKAGFDANAMVAWRVDEDKVGGVGELMAARPEISHCYVRRTYPDWQYNLYTMIHGKRPEDIEAVIEAMKDTPGIIEWDILESIKELKKTSMTYF
jgi:DNA-binding Lrp family transcriptional regulator